MSGKQSKKYRQLFRKTSAQEAKKMGEMLGNAMKPKPKWVPWPVWMFLVRLVMKVQK